MNHAYTLKYPQDLWRPCSDTFRRIDEYGYDHMEYMNKCTNFVYEFIQSICDKGLNIGSEPIATSREPILYTNRVDKGRIVQGEYGLLLGKREQYTANDRMDYCKLYRWLSQPFINQPYVYDLRLSIEESIARVRIETNLRIRKPDDDSDVHPGDILETVLVQCPAKLWFLKNNSSGTFETKILLIEPDCVNRRLSNERYIYESTTIFRQLKNSKCS